MKKLLQRRFKIPFISRNTTKKIKAKRIVFGKSVAGDVRFSEQAKTSDTTSARKLMPLRCTNGAQLHAANHAMEERFDRAKVAQRIR